MPRVRKQLYRCRSCGRPSWENPTPHASPSARREEILHASQEREPLAWPEEHLRGFSHNRVHLDQKKGAQLSPLCTTLLAPEPEDPTSTMLELDERMARLCSKKRTPPGCGWPFAERADRWSLLPLGIGAGKTCQRLWEAIPSEYRQGHCKTRLFESLCFCHPGGAAYSCGPARPEKRLTWSAGTTPYESRWPVLCA